MRDSLPKEFWAVLMKRYEKMPSDVKIVIGGFGAMDKKEIMEHIKKKDEVGALIAQIELNYLKLFKEEAETYERAYNKART